MDDQGESRPRRSFPSEFPRRLLYRLSGHINSYRRDYPNRATRVIEAARARTGRSLAEGSLDEDKGWYRPVYGG